MPTRPKIECDFVAANAVTVATTAIAVSTQAELERQSHDPTLVLRREIERKRSWSRTKMERELLRESVPERATDNAEYISVCLALDLEREDILGAHRRSKPKGDPTRTVPIAFDDCGAFYPEVASRMSSRQAEQAHLLLETGLVAKARRHAWCGIIARPLDCVENPAHKFYRKSRCYLRYCPVCGPSCFRELFNKHVRLASVVERLLQHSLGDHRPRVLAKLDFTVRKLDRMATRDEVRQFNKDVRRFFRSIERLFGISRKEYGALWCCEFGSGNTNLHAHAVYCGPWIPQKEISRLWAKIRADGSFIVSIKHAKSFEAALSHALKYPSKFFDAAPIRLVDLELAFDRVRRVHAVAAFYNPRIEREPGEEGPENGCCPICRALLGEPKKGWAFVDCLQREGRRDLEEVRASAGVRMEEHERRVAGTDSGAGPP